MSHPIEHDINNTNVSLYNPTDRSALSNIKTAKWWARIEMNHTPEEVAAAFKATPAARETFCTFHSNVILIFSQKKDTHGKNCSTIMDMLTAHKMTRNVEKTAWWAMSAEMAGFRFDEMGWGANMVVLMVDLGWPGVPGTDSRGGPIA